ncbi:MAG: hypothetical protein FWB85_01025 [Chitinispirillia bacterium]|nr:hypothetical protein [Chitinispirillia bacterium]
MPNLVPKNYDLRVRSSGKVTSLRYALYDCTVDDDVLAEKIYRPTWRGYLKDLLWEFWFDKDEVVKDDHGIVIKKDLYGKTGDGGWDIGHRYGLEWKRISATIVSMISEKTLNTVKAKELIKEIHGVYEYFIPESCYGNRSGGCECDSDIISVPIKKYLNDYSPWAYIDYLQKYFMPS